MRKSVVISFLVIIFGILSIFLIFQYANHKTTSNSLYESKINLKITTLATFTHLRYIRIKKFNDKLYVLTDNSILDIHGKVLFKFKAVSPFDFVVSNGNYFVSDLPENKVITNKGIIKTDVWPSIMKLHNGKLYVSTLRSNKLDIIDTKKCEIVSLVRTVPVPVDFTFIKNKLYVLSSGAGAVFGNGHKVSLDFGVFSIFSNDKYIFVISPKKIYKLDLDLHLLDFIETNYLINYAFFDKFLYVCDTFGYIRKFDLNLKEIDFKKFTDYAISVFKDNSDFYISNITGVYKNDELILHSNSIVDLFDKDHILYSDGRVKIGKKIIKISGYPKRIIFNGSYTFCFTQGGYIYMFDKDANLILKKFINGGIEDVELFNDRFYIVTLGSIIVLDKTSLNPIVSKRISILPYKMKFYNGHVYILSVFSRTINEYSQDLSLIKEYPLQKTSYDFYFYDSKLQIDPNLIFSTYIKKYNLLVSYDGENLYFKGKNFFKKIKINLEKIIVSNNIFALTDNSLILFDIEQ